MTYTVTFYALRPGLGEIAITVHRVERGSLIAYTGAPAVALGAARTVKGDLRPDGFRVVDASGHIILNYVDKYRGG